MRDINRPKQFLRSLLVVNELALRNDTGIQYFVPEADRCSVLKINLLCSNVQSICTVVL